MQNVVFFPPFSVYFSWGNTLSFAFFGLAVLFQPLVKIALGRTLWNILDVAVAIFLVVLTFIEKPKPTYK